MLIAKAYRILARRWKTPFGEIDIVARRRGILVFVEVKARASADDAMEAVTERTKHRIISAAEMWLARYPGHANGEIRFDVVVVTPGKLPRHIVNAFNAGGKWNARAILAKGSAAGLAASLTANLCFAQNGFWRDKLPSQHQIQDRPDNPSRIRER